MSVLVFVTEEDGHRVAEQTGHKEEAKKETRDRNKQKEKRTGGTSFGAPMKPRPGYGVWPTLVPRDLVRQNVEILEA